MEQKIGINPAPNVLHENDLQGQYKWRKMLGRLAKGIKLNPHSRWARNHKARTA